MKLNKEVIDDVLADASISEVIGHYLPLVKKGRNYSAVCPFHDDHDPSLSISEDKQIYKCFVCGKGGNVFTFVMDYKYVSFQEAVKEVALIEGKHLDIDIIDKPKKVSPYERLYNLMNEASSFTSYLLNAKSSEVARNYLASRNLEKDIIEEFNIGYNPNGSLVCNYLKEKGYSDNEILDTNIGRLYKDELKDVFADRILFPIHDKEGHVVAFTARDITKHSEAKYINTSETKIYTKGNILYNQHRALPYVKEANRVLVCEGVMDVIAFKRAGIPYTVATLGTACSKEQLVLLKQMSHTLVLAYDGDNAGLKANLRLGEMALKEGMNVYAINNNTGLDPDEILLTYEEKGLRDLVSKAKPFIDFAFDYYKNTLNLENYSDRKEMTAEMSHLISLLRDNYDRTNYSDELYRITGLRIIDGETKEKVYNKKKISTQFFSVDGLTMAEYTILVLIATSKRGLEIYKQELGSLLHEPCQKMAYLISEDIRHNGNCSFPRLYNECQDENLKKLITDLSLNESLPKEYDEELLHGAILKVKDEMRKRRLQQIALNIHKVQDVDPIRAQELLNEYARIVKEIGGSYDK